MQDSAAMKASGSNEMSVDGEFSYRVRCIDKLEHAFRGDESLLDAGCGYHAGRRTGCLDTRLRLRGQHPSGLTTGELRQPGTLWPCDTCRA